MLGRGMELIQLRIVRLDALLYSMLFDYLRYFFCWLMRYEIACTEA